MSRERPLLCMFCGKDSSVGRMNVEHLVPKGLWSSKRPVRTKTLPAHVACNAKFAADNEYFRDVLVSNERTSNHPEVVKLRSGELTRKMASRLNAVSKVYKNLRMSDVLSSGGIFLRRAPVFDVDITRIDRVLCNIVRGVFYVIKGGIPGLEWVKVGLRPRILGGMAGQMNARDRERTLAAWSRQS